MLLSYLAGYSIWVVLLAAGFPRYVRVRFFTSCFTTISYCLLLISRMVGVWFGVLD